MKFFKSADLPQDKDKILRQYIHTILKILVIISPIILLLVIGIVSGKWNSGFYTVPIWSDEIAYWREMYSVDRCGFSFGGTGFFTGCDALIGPLEAHGLGPIAAWGWYVLLFPWNGNSVVLANMTMLMLAYFIFIVITKPSIGQTILLLVVAIAYPPLICYSSSSMMELPCYAGIIVCIALLFYYESHAEAWVFVIIILGVTYCSILRICYMALLFPGILRFCQNKPCKKLWLMLVAYNMWFCCIRVLSLLFSAKYPFRELPIIMAQLPTLSKKLSFLMKYFTDNIARFFAFTDDPVQVSQRYFLVALSLLLIAQAIACYKIQHHLLNAGLGMFAVLFGMTVMIIMLYDIFDWRDYRTLAPMAFGTLLWFILYINTSMGHRLIGSIAVVCSAVLVVIFLCNIPRWMGVADRKMLISDFLWPQDARSDSGVLSPTVTLYEVEWSYNIMKNIPPQFGIQFAVGEKMLSRVKSDFILVADTISSNKLPIGYELFYSFPNQHFNLYKYNK